MYTYCTPECFTFLNIKRKEEKYRLGNSNVLFLNQFPRTTVNVCFKINCTVCNYYTANSLHIEYSFYLLGSLQKKCNLYIEILKFYVYEVLLAIYAVCLYLQSTMPALLFLLDLYMYYDNYCCFIMFITMKDPPPKKNTIIPGPFKSCFS